LCNALAVAVAATRTAQTATRRVAATATANLNTTMAIELQPEKRKHLIAQITSFIYDEFEIEIGELRATLVLDFMNKHVAAAAYNQGVADSQAYLTNKLADMGIDLHEE